jgi:glycosyltransferase involved in cell wall biosynthesis
MANEIKRPKILMISARADFGGGPEHILTLATNLENKAALYIACPQEYPYWDRFNKLVGDSQVVEVPHRAFKFKALWKLKSFAEANGIDIIHSHGKGAGLYGRLLSIISKKPSVYTFHGLHISQYNILKKLLYLLYERVFSYLTVFVIAVSQSERVNLLVNKVCARKKVIVIPNGVAIPRNVSSVTLADDCFNIVSVTRYNTQKNPSLLKKIIELLSEEKPSAKIKFYVLGEGEGYADFCDFISENNLDKMVEVVGATTSPNDYFSLASCFLSTSLWEGMPLSMMEAMSYGVPAIATSVVGNVDVVSHGNDGYLYAIDKPEEAVKQIASLIENRDLLRVLSRKAREKAIKNFTSERMAELTLQCYVNILKEKRS